LLAKVAATNRILKKLISDQEAQFNNNAESNTDLCYTEFQAYFNLEDKLINRDFKN
ncbi:hypothetical protein IWW34DRAFT_600863, partial [Fusarium oxysporum f. sp. albedinis]